MRITPAVVVAASLSTPVMAADWGKVDQALGRSGTSLPGEVHRYGFPRSDLHVTLDGVTLLPALALGGWLAFKAEGDGAMVMGDLVLTEDEINPVMSKLLATGISVTALHNHVIRAQPATFYMHVEGHGDATQLATELHDALAASRTPLTPPGTAAVAKPDLDAEQIEQVIGRKGSAVGGVLQCIFDLYPNAHFVEHSLEFGGDWGADLARRKSDRLGRRKTSPNGAYDQIERIRENV